MKLPEKQNRQGDNKSSQHIPKHVTLGGTISLPSLTTKKKKKKDQRVTQEPHVCTVMCARSGTQATAPAVDVSKKGCIKGISWSSASPVAGRGCFTHSPPCGANTPTLSHTHYLFTIYFIVLNGPHRKVFLHCIFNTKETKKGSRKVTIFM